MKRLFPLLLAFLCLTACGARKNHNAQSPMSEHIKTDSFEGYIFPKEHIINGMYPQEKGYTLNDQQVILAEKIVCEHLNEVLEVCPFVNLRTYKRQYFGRVDTNGDIIVDINLYAGFIAGEELAEDRLEIDDGGCGIIYISVNLNKRILLHISHNGYA